MGMVVALAILVLAFVETVTLVETVMEAGANVASLVRASFSLSASDKRARSAAIPEPSMVAVCVPFTLALVFLAICAWQNIFWFLWSIGQ